MKNNFFISNEEQIRSLIVSFCIFLIKEMYQEHMLNSNEDEIELAQYYDNKIDKYINDIKESQFIMSERKIRSLVNSFVHFLISELYQENVLKSNSDVQSMESYYDSKINIFIKERKYRKERI